MKKFFISFLISILSCNLAFASNIQQVPPGTVIMSMATVTPTGYLQAYGQSVLRSSYPQLFNALSISITANTTNSSACLTSPSSTLYLAVGARVEGTNITSGTTIAGLPGTCSSGQIQMSANATGTTSSVTVTVISTGAADTTHFNIPDCRGRVVAGMDTLGGSAAGRLNQAETQGVVGSGLANSGGEQGHTQTISELVSHSHAAKPNNFLGGTTYILTLDPVNYDTGTGYDSSVTYGGTSYIAGLMFETDYKGGGSAFNVVQPTIVMNCLIKT